jgi:hypothetical protein
MVYAARSGAGIEVGVAVGTAVAVGGTGVSVGSAGVTVGNGVGLEQEETSRNNSALAVSEARRRWHMSSILI